MQKIQKNMENKNSVSKDRAKRIMEQQKHFVVYPPSEELRKKLESLSEKRR